MRKWDIEPGQYVNQILSSDARLSPADYTNDQVWEIVSGGGDPEAFLIQTTFGLRSRWMRIFPRFIRQNQIVCNPADFHRQPVLTTFYPNYLSYDFLPYPGIEARLDYRMVDSQTLSGRLLLVNKNRVMETFRLEWCALLNSAEGGKGMLPGEPGSLVGENEDLHPVIFLSGNPDSGSSSLPALAHNLELAPGNPCVFTWGFAALSNPSASYAAALRAAGSCFEAETARIELVNKSQSLEITTGNPDWDLAFAMSQKYAFSLFFPASKRLPNPSFVLSRLPDQGYSGRGDGSDYSHLWNGQTALDAYFLAGLLLPGNVEFVKGLVNNFIHTQKENGFIDLKPGLGGQHALQLAQPLLATLTLEINRCHPNPDWLEDIFPALYRFFQLWFDKEHDRDGDGYPEWDHPLQAGLADAPIYDRWCRQSQGVNITALESPSLAAFLFREANSLAQLAQIIGHNEMVPPLKKRAEALKRALSRTWDPKTGYHYRDYQSHKFHKAVPLLKFNGSGTFSSRHSLPFAQRLLIQIHCKEEITKPVRIELYGENGKTKIKEEIVAGRFTWVDGMARVTSVQLYRRLDKVEVHGLNPDDSGEIQTIDLTLRDISLYLPLWAGMVPKVKAQEIIKIFLVKKFLQPFGLPISEFNAGSEDSASLLNVSIPWNRLIIEGLLEYGYRPEAAEIFNRLMSAICNTLKQSHDFREFYNSKTGQSGGKRNHLHGLAPIGLFLQILGVKILSERDIILQGINPFSWPVTVKYKGTSITRHEDDSVINFFNGQTVSIKGAKAQRITLDEKPDSKRRN